MTPLSEQARIIVGKLTRKQRDTIAAMTGEYQRAVSFSGSSAEDFCWANSRRPALAEYNFAGRYGKSKLYRLTPLGLAVRQLLQEQSQ